MSLQFLKVDQLIELDIQKFNRFCWKNRADQNLTLECVFPKVRVYKVPIVSDKLSLGYVDNLIKCKT